MLPRVYLCLSAALMFPAIHASAAENGRVTYLANTGLLVESGDTKVLFDPLFRNSYGHYQLLPADLEQDLLAGLPPFDGVDAVFISHFHGDHFDAQAIATYLRAQAAVILFAPQQAIDELEFFVDAEDSKVRNRLRSVDLDYGEPAQVLSEGDIDVEAFHIPHSGWPQRRPDVQNIAFRVTLNDGPVVLHMGDADTRPEHFANDAEQWDAQSIDMAFPPYWYFMSANGRSVLTETLQPGSAVGVHVPVELDAETRESVRDFDLFRRPGETRDIGQEP